MSIDPKEFRRRRIQRDIQRHQKRRATRIRLAIFGGVAALLLLVGLSVFFLLHNIKSPAAQAPTAPPATQAPESTQENAAPSPGKTVVKIAATGDLNPTKAVVSSGGSNYDYTQTFLDVAPMLADADLSVVNFEGNLYGQPYGDDRSAPQNLMTSLRNIGVDMIQLANSYSIYKGMHGLVETIDGVRRAGMEPLGVYPSAEAAKEARGFTLWNVRGVKIAFVSFTKGMDGMALPPGNEGCVNVLYEDYSTDYQTIDTKGITKILDAINREQPDLTVAMLHWGSEFNNNISQSQKNVRDLLLENGVDAIIGTHSHYVQSITYDQATGQLVAYSLGDFIGDAAKAGSEYSIILELEVTKDNASGETKITNYKYTPIFTVNEPESPLRILRIPQAVAAYEEGYIGRVTQETYAAMLYAQQRIDARVKEPVKE